MVYITDAAARAFAIKARDVFIARVKEAWNFPTLATLKSF